MKKGKIKIFLKGKIHKKKEKKGTKKKNKDTKKVEQYKKINK